MFDFVYEALIERLLEIKEIKYIDLWNDQPNKIEPENLDYPAVFIEFASYEPTPGSDGTQTGSCRINIYVVVWTDAGTNHRSPTRKRGLKPFTLCGQIQEKLFRFSKVDPENKQGGFSAMVMKSYRPDANYDSVLVHTLSYETKLHDTTCRFFKNYVPLNGGLQFETEIGYTTPV